ncbi:uncharacterized protein [Amphiura filiformis]|uniref:uncharacterized protein n=1 Tax=Amphiura filiformis TaxID=82378 RepID=UPI003B211B18
MAAIDLLNVDELLIIFNLLSLFDKLMTLRVCKKWYNIIQDTHAWKVINLEEEGPVLEEIDDGKKKYKRFTSKDGKHVFDFRQIHTHWRFPASHHDNVLRFVKLYAGLVLQELHIFGMSCSVVDILHIKCPNLKQIYFSITDNEMNAICRDQEKVCYLQQILVECRISCHRNMNPNLILEHEQILILLAQCSNLRSVTLQGFNLSSSGLQQLSTHSHLREIQLLHCSCNQVDRDDLIVNFDFRSMHLDDILTDSVGSITSMSRFRLSGQHSKIDNLMVSIGGWEHLQDLCLKDVWYSEQTFEMMVSRLSHLHSLVLDRVTSPVVSLVGKYLKELKFLDLTEGLRSISCESLRSLCHHPCLETLWYSGNSSLSVHTIHAIYEVIGTLVNINYVKLTGHNVHNLYNHQVFPIVESTEIEIVDLGNERFNHRALGVVNHVDAKIQETWKRTVMGQPIDTTA